MSDLKLFRIDAGIAVELLGAALALEKPLQVLIENNMEVLFGVRLVASEHSTGKKHGGRIDSLGLDENGSPVIFEYKRSVNENVINQGLFYLDWLLDHRADFELLVMRNLGPEQAGQIDWSRSRSRWSGAASRTRCSTRACRPGVLRALVAVRRRLPWVPVHVARVAPPLTAAALTLADVVGGHPPQRPSVFSSTCWLMLPPVYRYGS